MQIKILPQEIDVPQRVVDEAQQDWHFDLDTRHFTYRGTGRKHHLRSFYSAHLDFMDAGSGLDDDYGLYAFSRSVLTGDLELLLKNATIAEEDLQYLYGGVLFVEQHQGDVDADPETIWPEPL